MTHGIQKRQLRKSILYRRQSKDAWIAGHHGVMGNGSPKQAAEHIHVLLPISEPPVEPSPSRCQQ